MPKKLKETDIETVGDTTDPRDKILQAALGTIDKDFGVGTVLMGSGKIPGIQTISSGCKSIDKALGGGWARGRMHEVYGPESSGKTTLALHGIAQAQKLGMKAAFIDVEHSLDGIYAQALGVNIDELIFSQPDTGEQALEVLRRLIATGAVGFCVLDSIAGLIPAKEMEGQVGDAQMGRQALMMSQACRMLNGPIFKTNTTVLFINQIRMKSGVMFGNPETVTGGNALKFYATQRVDIRRTGAIKEGEEHVGNDTRIKVVKNKIFPPFKEATFRIKFGEGIDVYGDVLGMAVDKNIIAKSGSWYSYGDKQIGQGADQTIAYLKAHLDEFEVIQALV